MALADTTALLALVQSLNVADAEPGSVYMSSKSLSQLIPSGTPEGFVTAVRDRLQNPATKDDLAGFAYLAKTMVEVDGYNVINGAWYGYGATVKSMSNLGKTKFPAWTNDTLPVPTGVEVFTTSQSARWVPSGGIPAWWNDNTLVRLRCWGAGGSGSYRIGNYAAGGGGGGGYGEYLVPYSRLSSFGGGIVTVGAGGVGITSYGVGNGGGWSGIGSLGASGGGPGWSTSTNGNNYSNITNNGIPSGTYWNYAYSSAMNEGSGYYGGLSTSGGYGLQPLLTAAVDDPRRWAIYGVYGGSSGNPQYSGSYIGYGASGGGGAGGPWGGGGQGGGPTGSNGVPGDRFYGGSGGGTGQSASGQGMPQPWTDAGSTTAFPGGSSIAYNPYWKTDYLLTRVGGIPGAAATSGSLAGDGGAGCGGGGGYSPAIGNTGGSYYRGGNGGIFGGGGGSGSNNSSGAGARGGNGGLAAGGGGTGSRSDNQSGNGGNGLVIIEYFV